MSHIFKFHYWFIRGTILLIAAMLIVLCRPYKKMYMNVCDSLTFSLSNDLFYVFTDKTQVFYSVYSSFNSLSINFAVLFFVVCFKLLCKVHRSLFNRSQCLTQYLPHCCLKADTPAVATRNQSNLITTILCYI